MKQSDTAILIFAKAPEAGKVKTRLEPLLGAAACAQLQQQLIENTVTMAMQAALCPIQLWVSGPQHYFSKYDLPIYQQQGEDLGQRMQYAVAKALQTTTQVLLIGTDCPALGASHLAAAVEQLQENDVVIIPAEDGGYVLLGLQQLHTELFTSIAWGDDQVYADTCKRLQRLGLQWQALPPLWDLDRPDDWSRWQQWLAEQQQPR